MRLEKERLTLQGKIKLILKIKSQKCISLDLWVGFQGTMTLGDQ